MPRLSITGWRPGVRTISIVKILRDHLFIRLKEAKDCVDDMVSGKVVSFPLGSSTDAEALKIELEKLGAIVQIEQH